MLVWGTGVVSGQNYPNKTLRIVTGEPGGGQDFAARLFAQGISGSLGQQVIVDNRPTAIAIDTVVKAPPDGYTILLQGNIIWTGPLLQKMSYDPVSDLSPITLAVIAPKFLLYIPYYL